MLNHLPRILKAHRFRLSHEFVLQNGIAGVLLEAGIPFEREHCLRNGRDRVDFFVDMQREGGIALEVKVDGSLSEVTRQLHRYAQHPDVRAIVLVTTRAMHDRMPAEMCGKPVRVIHLEGAF